MNLTERLLAAAGASPKLAAWLAANDHTEIVGIRVGASISRVRMAKIVLEKLADIWVKHNEDLNGGQRIDWSLIGPGELQYLLDDLKEGEYRTRMAALKLSDAALVTMLAEWKEEKSGQIPDGISIWTDAPKDYDHGYTYRTTETYTPRLLKKALTRVIIPSGSVSYQANRYGSGGHVAFDEARMVTERAYDEKAGRADAWTGKIAALRTVVTDTADIIPANRADGRWSLGGRVDYSTHRPVTLPPANPTGARIMLQQAQKTFYELPSEARNDEWRVGDDIDQLLRLALRAEERVLQANIALQGELKAMNEKIDTYRKADQPGWVLVLMKYDGLDKMKVPVKVLGRVLEWPTTKYGHIKTESGLASWNEELRAYPDKNYPPGTPAAVWAAGAGPTVVARAFGDRTIYGWVPTGYGAKLKVVDADGRTLGVNTKAYQSFSEHGDDGGSQDQVIDDALTKLLERGHPGPGWHVTETHPAGGMMLVEFKAPSEKQRGTAGWQVRKRIVARDAKENMVTVKNLILTRLGARHPTGKNYWRHAVDDGNDGIYSIPKMDKFFLYDVSREEAALIAPWLAEDPRRTVEQAREKRWIKP